MPLEKPISTIKKAVQAGAEELASKEFIGKPLPRHYDKVFLLFKTLRNINPKILEKVIMSSVKGKDLKEKLGDELMAVFENIVFEIAADYKRKLSTEIKKIEDDVSCKNKQEQILIVSRNIFGELVQAIKTEPRTVVAFADKKHLLNDALNFIQLDFPELLAASI